MNMLNSVILEGDITKAGNVVQFADKQQQLEVTIAVKRQYRNRAGFTVEETSEFDVVAYGNAAELLAKKGVIGQGIRVVGRLTQVKWEANGRQQSAVKLIAEHIEYKPKKPQKKEAESEK
jgi:single stranded DNA-binding protein